MTAFFDKHHRRMNKAEPHIEVPRSGAALRVTECHPLTTGAR
jgi:hypothetical protein